MKSPITAAKPKVIISSYDDVNNPFYAGGGARSINEVATRLASVFDITVITGNYRGAQNIVRAGVQYQRIGPSFLGPKMSQLAFHALLPFYARSQTFDIWIESFTPPISTSFLQRYTKKPVIGLIHMLAAEDMVRKYKLRFDLIENRGIKTYRHFIALTESTISRINRLNPQAAVTLIPNGVSLPKSQPSARRTEDYILYLGRLEFNQKGLDLLLDAYNSIAGKSDTKLVIAGAGSARDEQALNKKVHEYGLDARVTITGQVEGKQKDALLRGCKLVVVPSRLETFSVVTLEAMSYGKPVVSFDIPGLEWTPATCVTKAKAFDAPGLGQAIQRILADDKLRTSMSRAACAAAKQYSWENVAALYRQAIEEVLGK